ncbi:high choriolytic enzyme 1-like [Megalops cyprinoides]|uniref:high choriolytic enzyme 1-like n=1 Tax=Megalops cyprinoides TaxID=118141 RepID=UPI00186426DE|nr:high choriolytic enzyme 1-like [Megalops cyprinoides]
MQNQVASVIPGEEMWRQTNMNAMDRILEANRMMRSLSGLTLKEGDIARSSVRSAITCTGNSCLWPKSVDGYVYVPYIISSQYDNMDRMTIETGMQDISSGTCVKFVPRSHEANFLDIQPKLGCWSFLGVTGGAQILSLETPGCMWAGVASHELMHALGFVHEQSRSDRDRYVTILWDNILQDQVHNFKKYKTNNLNTAYDYNSIMHYGRYAFSEDGDPTIIPKPDPFIPIGQREGPSPTDIQKINVLYNCSKFNTSIFQCPLRSCLTNSADEVITRFVFPLSPPSDGLV